MPHQSLVTAARAEGHSGKDPGLVGSCLLCVHARVRDKVIV